MPLTGTSLNFSTSAIVAGGPIKAQRLNKIRRLVNFRIMVTIEIPSFYNSP
jgi:hypothetical protein